MKSFSKTYFICFENHVLEICFRNSVRKIWLQKASSSHFFGRQNGYFKSMRSARTTFGGAASKSPSPKVSQSPTSKSKMFPRPKDPYIFIRGN